MAVQKKDTKISQKKDTAIKISVERMQANAAKKDVAAWKRAWQMATNSENPRRQKLYEIYIECGLDSHLSGCIDQRKGFLKQKAFKLTDKSGKENAEVTNIFENTWFKNFVDYCLDSIYWGHSLIEFGDILRDGVPRFDFCDIVPRENVVPEYGVILKKVTHFISEDAIILCT
jgi:hypothetical protein